MPKQIVKRVIIGIDEPMADAIESLNGRQLLLRGFQGPASDHFPIRPIGAHYWPLNRYLKILLEEPVYAAEEFAEEHGYIPWQPRIAFVLENGTRPAEPRRCAKCEQEDAINKVLENATAAAASTDGGAPTT